MTDINTEEKDTTKDAAKDIIKGGLVSMDKLLKDANSSFKIYKENDVVESKVK